MKKMMKMKGMKGKGRKGEVVKGLTGKQKQTDTLSEKPTMGNFGGRAKKARDKRLEKMAV
jgi:hypothetical protein